jgi:hypothetical protein
MRLDTKEKRLAYRYIPKDSTEIRFESVDAVVYAQQTERGIIAIAYQGTAAHPVWNYSFKTTDRFQDYATEWAHHLSEWQKRKDERREARKAPHCLKVGNILRARWGYDQTNVDFYEVIAVRGKVVDVQEIGQHAVDRRGPSGDSVIPIRTGRGKIYRSKRPSRDGYVRIDDVISAHLWDGTPCYQTDSMFGH